MNKKEMELILAQAVTKSQSMSPPKEPPSPEPIKQPQAVIPPPSTKSPWAKLVKPPSKSPVRHAKTDFANNSQAYKEYKEKTREVLATTCYPSFSSHGG